MFESKICSHPDCNRSVISQVNNETHTLSLSDFCFIHSPDKEQMAHDILQYIEENDQIVGLACSNMKFSNLHYSGKKFFGCDFQNCTFENLSAENNIFRISMFDFSTFIDSNLSKSNFQYCSFAGCALSHFLMTDSDLIHNTFNGIIAHQSAWDNSDLYNSRFIRAKLYDTSLYNCNIKNVLFYNAVFENVSFKSSNTREAKFERDAVNEGLSIFGD